MGYPLLWLDLARVPPQLDLTRVPPQVWTDKQSETITSRLVDLLRTRSVIKNSQVRISYDLW